MGRNLKFLELAVSAMVINAAFANVTSADVLTSEQAPLTLSGVSEGSGSQVKVHGLEYRCTTNTFSGAVASTTATTFSLTPTYSGCTFMGFTSTINLNGCQFLFHLSSAEGMTTGTTDITCAAGKEIVVKIPSVGTPKCTLHFPPQEGLGTVAYSSVGASTTREVTFEANLTGIKYSQTAGSAETGNCATSDATTTGTHLVTAKLTGTSAGAHIGIFLS